MSGFDSQFRKFRRAANATPEEIARVSEAARHVTEEEVLQTYTLQLIGPPGRYPDGHPIGASINRAFLTETEENLTDLLPEGYSARIREWDAEEENE